jgi:hypothetical protein
MSVPRWTEEVVTVNWFRRSFISLGIIFLVIELMPNWRKVTTKNLAGAATESG